MQSGNNTDEDPQNFECGREAAITVRMRAFSGLAWPYAPYQEKFNIARHDLNQYGSACVSLCSELFSVQVRTTTCLARGQCDWRQLQ
jgi:hypothetical protein